MVETAENSEVTGKIAADEQASLEGVFSVVTEKGETVWRVQPDKFFEVMQTLHNDPEYSYEQVSDICGVDYPERAERFEVVYNLLSVAKNRRLRVIVSVAEGGSVPSVYSLWPSATWWEREVWDMFGVVFAGQPDMRRILTEYGFAGHPLRKDFPLTGYLEVRYDKAQRKIIHEPVRLAQDFRNFDSLSPWEGMTTLPGDEKVNRNG